MKTSDIGKNIIKTFEGCKLTAYKCSAGKWTIGYGNTFYADMTPVKEGDMIELKEAHELFELLLPKYERIVLRNIKVPLNQYQFDALVSHTYNTGGSETLFRLINEGAPLKDIQEWWTTKYVTAGGRFIRGLKLRREKEYSVFIL